MIDVSSSCSECICVCVWGTSPEVVEVGVVQTCYLAGFELSHVHARQVLQQFELSPGLSFLPLSSKPSTTILKSHRVL